MSKSKSTAKSSEKASEIARTNAQNRIKESNRHLITYTLLGASLFFSMSACGLSVINFMSGRSGGSLSWSFINGNAVNFDDAGDISAISNAVSKSVVSILTETRTTDWFGQSATSSAAGTGMIVTSDGYILTNKHVVDGAKKISVVLDDGTTYDNVKLVGTDPLNDVAFIKINGVSDLAPVTLGDSKTLLIGQEVIAIGNALGQYQNSVTEGIISGTGRSLIATDSSNSANYEQLSDMIQTDASINAGNSGGPLVNAAGQVIGINTAVYSNGNGIGFAIPISSIKGMLKSVIEKGKAERAYIGVTYANITSEIQKEYNLPVSEGAYVSGDNPIIKDGPANKAGIKSGDIITAVDGIQIGRAGSLSTLIGEHAAGEEVELTIIRDGKEQKIKLTTAAYTGK